MCRVMYTGSKFSIFMVYTERRVGVSCSVYDTLHTDAKGYIIICKLVKLAFCLCCIDTFPDKIQLCWYWDST